MKINYAYLILSLLFYFLFAVLFLLLILIFLVLGLLSSLALNRSEEISAFLKKVSTNYKSNEELIDPEKRDLYNQYKKYLKLIKEDESLKESLDNPMAPKDEEVRKTVEKIKERPFLQKDPHVSLEKKDALTLQFAKTV